MVETVKKPKPRKPYAFSLNITDEERAAISRRERRADELGIKLYLLDGDNVENEELQKLEDYIMENFIDLDLDVPEEVKSKYLQLKRTLDENN